MTLWMVTTSWMHQWVIRSEAPCAHVHLCERSETVRDGMGCAASHTTCCRLFNIQSDPCESRAAVEEEGRGNAPLESPVEV